jgi:hypothetical protein
MEIATEFPSQEALDKYMKDHPGADPKNHTVKKEEKSEGEATYRSDLLYNQWEADEVRRDLNRATPVDPKTHKFVAPHTNALSKALKLRQPITRKQVDLAIEEMQDRWEGLSGSGEPEDQAERAVKHLHKLRESLPK